MTRFRIVTIAVFSTFYLYLAGSLFWPLPSPWLAWGGSAGLLLWVSVIAWVPLSF